MSQKWNLYRCYFFIYLYKYITHIKLDIKLVVLIVGPNVQMPQFIIVEKSSLAKHVFTPFVMVQTIRNDKKISVYCNFYKEVRSNHFIMGLSKNLFFAENMFFFSRFVTPVI